MKKWIGVAAFSLFLIFPMWVHAVELGGGYSIIPLGGWNVRDFPGLKYKMVITEPVDGFAANLNVVDEAFGGSMEQYLELSVQTVKKLFKAEVLGQAPFSADNAKGMKLVTNTQHNELKLRQIFYVFDNSNGMKVVVTASSLLNSADENEKKFDTMVGSFRVN